jgi:hypothetical protein
VPLLYMLKTQEEPLELIFPRRAPINASPQGMEGGFEEPLPPSLRGVAMAQVLLDVGNHPGVEHALAEVVASQQEARFS